MGATEYQFSVPPDVRGGVVTMRFTNTGSLPHEFAFGRLDPGRGREDVRQVLEPGQGPPGLMKDVAGVPALSPGRSVTVTRTLEPATFVFLCFFPSPDGTPHAQLGMYTTFQIAGDTGEAPPRADLAISAGRRGLSVPEITAGEHTVELRNEGRERTAFSSCDPRTPKPRSSRSSPPSRNGSGVTWRGRRRPHSSGGCSRSRPGRLSWRRSISRQGRTSFRTKTVTTR